MALTGNITVGLDFKRTTTADLGSAPYSLNSSWAKQIADGTGINQANKIFVDKVTLAGGASVTYDLDGGALADPSGVSGGVVAALSRVVAIAIRRTATPAASTQDEDVHLKGDFVTTKLLGNLGSGSLADAVIPIGPGGVYLHVFPGANGVGVTASTGDQITLENVSGSDSVELEVVLIGS
jgi:hypothetical protein